MCTRRGFSLLEIVVVMGMFALLWFVAVPAFLSVWKNQRVNDTRKGLSETAALVRVYYDRENTLPTTLDDLLGLGDPASLKDAWRRPLNYFRNVSYDTRTYDAVIISAGANGVCESCDGLTDGGTFTPSGDDLWVLVSVGDLRQRKTSVTYERLDALARRAHDYYFVFGSVPSLPDLQVDSNLLNDGFGRPFQSYNNVTYNSVTYGFLLLSPGENGTIDSTVASDSLFTPSGDDLWVLVNFELDRNPWVVTSEKIARANQAYSLCQSTLGTSSCTSIVFLVSRNYLDGKDGYDWWGTLLYWDTNTFKSTGPDGIAGTADDF